MSPDSGDSSARPVASPEGTGAMLPWHLSAVGLCALHILLAWWARAPGVRTAHDDAVYLALARSLRHGGYNDLFQVGTPIHAKYPPVYPVFLLVWRTLFGTGFSITVFAGMLLSALALFLAYRVMANLASPLLAVALLAVLAVNPYLVHLAGVVMSEPLYMFLSVACIAALTRRPTRTGTLVFAGAAAIAAALTRSVGVSLVVALVVHWLLERRFKAAIALALSSGVTVGGWLLWTVVAPHQAVGKTYVADALLRPPGHASLVAVLATRAVRHVRSYLATGIPYQIPVPTVSGTLVDNIVASGLLALGMVAGFWLLWKRWRVAAIYMAVFGGLLAVWPWAVGRYVLPMFPVLVPAVLLGLGALAARVDTRWRSPVVLTLAALVLVTGLRRTAGEIGRASACDRAAFPFPAMPACMLQQQAADQVSFFNAVAYVRDHVPQDAQFLAVMGEPLWYYTGRRSIFYPNALSTSEAGFLPFLRSRGAGWILLGNLRYQEPGRMAALMRANCSGLELVARFPPRTYLFRLPAAGEARADGEKACAAMEAYRAATRSERRAAEHNRAGRGDRDESEPGGREHSRPAPVPPAMGD